MKLHFARTAAALAALCVLQPVIAHEGGSDGKLGTVHFQVSCSAPAQQEFDLAMARGGIAAQYE